MRHITRFVEPSILLTKKTGWTSSFVSSVNKRPDNSKYAHNEIRSVLDSMSFHKCYYCERKLKGNAKEIDHYVEVVEDKQLAFEWNNLYLSCDNCNNKLPNTSIPNADVLNPCINSDSDIQSHITFIDEEITAVSDSKIGSKTIQKFKLDTPLLDYLRGKQLKVFHQTLLKIKEKQIEEGRSTLLQSELSLIKTFTYSDRPYSLMFKVLLLKMNVI